MKTTELNEIPEKPTQSVADTLQLLRSWNLPMLCEKFQQHEVCTTALRYLSESDIIELIPKVGQRAIFRANLQKWHRELQKAQQTLPSADGQCQNTLKSMIDDVFEPNFLMKCEANDAMINIPYDNINNTLEQPLLEVLPCNSSTADHHQDAGICHTNKSPDPVCHGDDFQLQNDSSTASQAYTTANIKFNVSDVINASGEGRIIYHEYMLTKELSPSRRKYLVQMIIEAVIKRRIQMTAIRFQNIAQQLVTIFPTETQETYYVRRSGAICPKGSLYHKYLNLSRKLRHSGQLEYRRKRILYKFSTP